MLLKIAIYSMAQSTYLIVDSSYLEYLFCRWRCVKSVVIFSLVLACTRSVGKLHSSS